MKVSNKGLELIVRAEGEILNVYLDPIDLPTLGVGHLLTRSELKQYPVGTKISRALSRQFLTDDLLRFENALAQLVKVPLTQNQYDALVSLIFNIGIGGFTRSTLLKKLNRKDYTGAADAFLSWVRAGGEVLPGLVTRRKAERKLFLAPDVKPAIMADIAPVAGDGKAQTNSPSPSPVPPSKEETNLKDKASGYVDSLLSGVDRMTDAQTRISRSSWTKALWSKLLGLLAITLSFLVDNWEITVVGIVLILLAFWYLLHQKRKANQVKRALTNV